MKKLKTATILLTFLLVTSFAAAEPFNLDTTDQKENGEITNVETERTNFLQNLLRNSLSVVALDDDVEPGSIQTFETQNTLNQDVWAANLDFNIDVIYCGDECTDAPTGSCSEIGDVPEGEEDCIAHNVIDYEEPGDFTAQSGDTFWTSFDYLVPENAPEGTYLVQSFMYDRGNEEIVTDFSNDYFTVTKEGTTDPDEPDDSVQDPAVSAYKSPDVTVEGDTVTGTVYLENLGGDMLTTNIVEMQVKTPQNRFLSFVSDVSTCDPSHPATVNKEFKLEGSEREQITLTSSDLPDGKYDIVFVTATDCVVNGDGTLVEPYSSSTDNYRETVTVGNPDDETEKNGLPVLPIILIVGAGIVGVILVRGL